MKALTVWQPWASLIILGAKPYEFRRWDYRTRAPDLCGQRIAIHAGARPIKSDELHEIFARINDGESALDTAIAIPLLKRVTEAQRQSRAILPHSAVLGTAILGEPLKSFDLFKHLVADSSRLDQHVWAWPLTDIVKFDVPVDYRGAQGFWHFPEALAA